VYTAGGFLGKPPLFVLAQIMISASFGLCVAAVRLRTGTIWTAVFLHALTNVLRCSSGPDGIDGASQDAVLIAAGLVSLIYVGYGLFLLRHEWFSGPRSKGEMEGSVAA
jgi:membrane protease YdiL (CAAX protease family)